MRLATGAPVGPRMLAAWTYVRDNPGCAILPVARSVGPNGSLRFGYLIVHRAIKAGMIEAARDSRGRYSLSAVAVDVRPNVHRRPFSNYVQRR